MGVTIKDVAKKTGLSITTVSLVLNKKDSRIPEKTREIIENVAQELRYAPNQAAISLSTKKTGLIALVIPRKTFFFFADLLSSVESSCRNNGYALNISLPERDELSCLEALRETLRRGADGVIFDPSFFRDEFFPAYRDLILESESPICSLSGIGANLLPNSIIPDHRQGAYLAASHLLGHGHNGIGLLAGSKENHVVSALLRGIEDALEEKNLPSNVLSAVFCNTMNGGTINGEDSAAFGYEGFESLLNTRPEGSLAGIITGSAGIAAGVLRRANEMGIKIPEQLSVISYGNIPPDADYSPPLSTVSIHYDRIALKAVNLIKKLIQGGPALSPEMAPPSLILRGSTV